MAKYRTACCNEVVESKHRHDFKRCPCGQTAVDGGDAYEHVLYDDKIGPPVRIAPAPIAGTEGGE